MDDKPGSGTDAPARVLVPGRTCWRISRTERFALVVDAADYFAHARAAMLRARRSIFLIGWDFDLGLDLVPGGGDDGAPTQLGEFLKHLVRRTPDLRISILKWDMAFSYSLSRQMLSALALELSARERIRLRFDSTHPWTAAHHQKIVVIDDALAFCGGIDMTDGRWDTRGHLPGDPCRVAADGGPTGPWHDATAVVDGEAARALGELARLRWRRATGARLRPAAGEADPWPADLAPQLRGVDVGISRTMPAYAGDARVREVEGLWLAAIGSARRTVYIESQYFASAAICDALARRLAEPDGPEVVVVNPLATEGWLERKAMGTARDLRLAAIRRADAFGRFAIHQPVNAAGEPIYVHAKVLVVDDRLLRVGSSNVNNRSMGFDTECDLTVEARGPEEREAVRAMRDDLVAEHLDVAPDRLRAEVEAQGSLRAAVEALRRPEGRSLRPIPLREVDPEEELLARSHLADPERPAGPESRVAHIAKRLLLRIPPLAWVVAAVAALALPWMVLGG